jgi:hypothetical protein
LRREWKGYCRIRTGDTLGFTHEHNRPDNMGQSCNAGNGKATTYHTPYDDRSITNATYCHWRPELSPWDVAGLQRIYGRKPVGSLVGANNKCADVQNPGAAEPGGATRLQAWDCLGNNNQRWDYDAYRFRAGGFNYGFMDVQWGNPASGTPVWNWVDQSNAAQLWALDKTQIVGMGDLCLRIFGAQVQAGQPLEMATCSTGDDAQFFSILHNFSNPSYPIRIAKQSWDGNFFCVAVSGQRGQATLQPCNGDASQQDFYIGERHIENVHACLDVRGAVPEPSTIAWGWPCDWDENAEAQHWKFRGPIVGLASKCLDFRNNGGIRNGSAVQIWDCHGGSNQSWEFHF